MSYDQTLLTISTLPSLRKNKPFIKEGMVRQLHVDCRVHICVFTLLRRGQLRIMSGSRKRPSSATSVEGSSSAKRRSVPARTVEKWKLENDRELNTATWLSYEMSDHDHVASLSCSVCTQFKAKLEGMRNCVLKVLETFVHLVLKITLPQICTREQCCY